MTRIVFTSPNQFVCNILSEFTLFRLLSIEKAYIDEIQFENQISTKKAINIHHFYNVSLNCKVILYHKKITRKCYQNKFNFMIGSNLNLSNKHL